MAHGTPRLRLFPRLEDTVPGSVAYRRAAASPGHAGRSIRVGGVVSGRLHGPLTGTHGDGTAEGTARVALQIPLPYGYPRKARESSETGVTLPKGDPVMSGNSSARRRWDDGQWPCPNSCTTRNESLSGQDNEFCLALDCRGRRGRRAHEALRRPRASPAGSLAVRRPGIDAVQEVLQVGIAVAVEVARAIAVERSEVAHLPLVRHAVAILIWVRDA